MAICEVNSKNYCKRHRCIHTGRVLELALDPGPIGEQYRKLWDSRIQEKPRVSKGTLSRER